MSNNKVDLKTPSWGFSGYITILPPEPKVELTDNSDQEHPKQSKCEEEPLRRPSR
jgi:hypothetical protein